LKILLKIDEENVEDFKDLEDPSKASLVIQNSTIVDYIKKDFIEQNCQFQGNKICKIYITISSVNQKYTDSLKYSLTVRSSTDLKWLH